MKLITAKSWSYLFLIAILSTSAVGCKGRFIPKILGSFQPFKPTQKTANLDYPYLEVTPSNDGSASQSSQAPGEPTAPSGQLPKDTKKKAKPEPKNNLIKMQRVDIYLHLKPSTSKKELTEKKTWKVIPVSWKKKLSDIRQDLDIKKVDHQWVNRIIDENQNESNQSESIGTKVFKSAQSMNAPIGFYEPVYQSKDKGRQVVGWRHIGKAPIQTENTSVENPQLFQLTSSNGKTLFLPTDRNNENSQQFDCEKKIEEPAPSELKPKPTNQFKPLLSAKLKPAQIPNIEVTEMERPLYNPASNKTNLRLKVQPVSTPTGRQPYANLRDLLYQRSKLQKSPFQQIQKSQAIPPSLTTTQPKPKPSISSWPLIHPVEQKQPTKKANILFQDFIEDASLMLTDPGTQGNSSDQNPSNPGYRF